MHVMKTLSRMGVIILHNIAMLTDCPYLTGLHAGVGSEEKTEKNFNSNIFNIVLKCRFKTDNEHVLILITVPQNIAFKPFLGLKNL